MSELTKGHQIYRLHNQGFKLLSGFFNFNIPFMKIQFKIQKYQETFFFQQKKISRFTELRNNNYENKGFRS